MIITKYKIRMINSDLHLQHGLTAHWKDSMVDVSVYGKPEERFLCLLHAHRPLIYHTTDDNYKQS